MLAVALIALSVAWLAWSALADTPKRDQAASILTVDREPGRSRVVGQVPDRPGSSDALLLAGLSVVLVGGLLALRGVRRQRPDAVLIASEPDATGDDPAAPIGHPDVETDVQPDADIRPGGPNQARSRQGTAAGHERGDHVAEPFLQAGITVSEPGSASASFACDSAASEVRTRHAEGGEQSRSAYGRVPQPSPPYSLGERIYERPARPDVSQEQDSAAGR